MLNSTFLRLLKIVSGPLAGFICWQFFRDNDNELLGPATFVVVWMAVWWIIEAVNIYITALLPLVLFPLLGVSSMKEVAPNYMNHIIFLFVGGFILAFAMERWNLHKRIAFKIILSMGSSPARILLGFMLASYLLSMWIMNTATVMMLLPALIAVADQLEQARGGSSRFIATPLLLGLAYASSIGGTATVIGTAPNVYLMQFFNDNFPDYPPITFARWMLIGLPLSAVFFIVCYWVIRWKYLRGVSSLSLDMEYCRKQYKALGNMTFEEKVVSVVFLITVLLWLFGKDIAVGNLTIRGWTNILKDPKMASEGTVAIMAAVFLLVFPAKNDRGKAIITWKEVQKLPIGVILLFGGGFALASGVTQSGLSNWLADHLIAVTEMKPLIMILLLSAFMTFFTELTSNTASTILVLGFLIPIAQNSDYHPFLLLLPVTISASFAFMLPVATPPNTIVFGSERLMMRDMVRTGIWLNLIGIGLMALTMLSLGKWLFGF